MSAVHLTAAERLSLTRAVEAQHAIPAPRGTGDVSGTPDALSKAVEAILAAHLADAVEALCPARLTDREEAVISAELDDGKLHGDVYLAVERILLARRRAVEAPA